MLEYQLDLIKIEDFSSVTNFWGFLLFFTHPLVTIMYQSIFFISSTCRNEANEFHEAVSKRLQQLVDLEKRQSTLKAPGN